MVRAAGYRGRGDIRIGEIAEPVPLSGELLLVDEGIRPLASGTSTRVKTLVDPWTSATRRTQL